MDILLCVTTSRSNYLKSHVPDINLVTRSSLHHYLLHVYSTLIKMGMLIFVVVFLQKNEGRVASDHLLTAVFRVDYKLITIPVVFTLLRVWSVILSAYLFFQEKSVNSPLYLRLLTVSLSWFIMLSSLLLLLLLLLI